MDKRKTRYRKKHFIDRIHLLDDEPVEPVITRNKFSKIRKKFDEPIQESFVDGWGDDMEVDCK